MTLTAPTIDFAKGGGLAPAIAQDAATLQVLMLAFMDAAALAETAASGEATFYSRSRGGRWRKGETSGHRLRVVSIEADCDSDAILLKVEPMGPACHRGTASCFADAAAPGIGRLGLLERTIGERSTGDGYTARLLQGGARRIAQKVGEEGVETALAGAGGGADELCAEAADLLYHLLVLLKARGRSLDDVMQVLARRAEKKS
ncbi:MAG TPA: bifunctional phosphoribosyl-AMP cyclohydrolase/phosphoribosyl-ATP diphosphatase [Parvularcula sp.]|nr:bifunctional phosphoribosyl-AMP cyclohydrolase/phosphoribosyl-ATP diphosphatase [Parvularcula sp.]HBS33382.1 bifunctional phosphoribosyl-AMP cyclohydrolase/phosphoribosyl-ATP diphosphatase [Parvularcula sp.]